VQDNRKTRRLINLLRSGRCISGDIEWQDSAGEEGITSVNLCPHNHHYRVRLERFLKKDAMCEVAYLQDEVRDFASLEEAAAFIEGWGIAFEQLHG